MKYFFILISLFSVGVMAESIDGEKKVFLENSTGDRLYIANIEFETVDEKIFYKLTIVDDPFTDQFLSMRPFQCIMDDRQVMCHVPYPYTKKGYITESDLSNLSYDLLFLYKSPAEYGINLWNGMFYKLTMQTNSIAGTVYEVDMNVIASPPENKDVPFAEDEIFDVDTDSYIYPKILIQ